MPKPGKRRTKMSLFYTKPEGNDDHQDYFQGPCKEYVMCKGDIIVTSYFGKGVEVYYAPTCETHMWKWADRNKAWEWANMRKQHLGYVIAGGKYSSSYTQNIRV
jgi:hypothetical protein